MKKMKKHLLKDFFFKIISYLFIKTFISPVIFKTHVLIKKFSKNQN